MKEPMNKYSKEEIALMQLEAAIELFWEARYIPAITLAGASEEVYDALLKQHSDKIGIPLPNQAEMEKAIFDAHYEIIGIRNYIAYRNNTKNELKHHGDERNKDFVKGDFKQIAMNHIAGAVINCKMRTGKIPESEIVIEHCRQVGLS